MKKLTKVLAGSSILLSLFFFSCASVEKSETAEDIVNFVEINEDLNYLNGRISYPEFLNYPDLTEKISESVAENWFNFRNYSEKNWQEGSFPFEYVVNSDITYSEDIISVKVDEYMFTGGNHGETKISTFNFNTKDNKFVNIEEISGYTYEELSKISKEALSDVMISEEGLAPVPENFNDFTVNGNEITIYFEQYDVSSYSEGVQTVKIIKK